MECDHGKIAHEYFAAWVWDGMDIEAKERKRRAAARSAARGGVSHVHIVLVTASGAHQLTDSYDVSAYGAKVSGR